MIIDADSHVEESQAMFSLLEKDFYNRRPLPVSCPDDTVCGMHKAVWLI